jgi:hypothetical protein
VKKLIVFLYLRASGVIMGILALLGATLTEAPAPLPPPAKLDAGPAVALLLSDSESLELMGVTTGRARPAHLRMPLAWVPMTKRPNQMPLQAGYIIPYTAVVRSKAWTLQGSEMVPSAGTLYEFAGRDSLVAPFVVGLNAAPGGLDPALLKRGRPHPVAAGACFTIHGTIYGYVAAYSTRNRNTVVSYPYSRDASHADVVLPVQTE